MRKVMVVDDSEVIRTIVTQTLALFGVTEIETACDGVEALEKIARLKGQVGLFVFDVNMPRMDGITLVKEVRRLDPATPIIMLTTETDKSKMYAARDHGATAWVVKPFQGEQFAKVVKTYLG